MSVCDIDLGLELRKANEEGYIEGYDTGITKVLKDATEEQFKAEAKRRGYNLIKIPENVKLLPCVCGRKRLEQRWCTYDWSYFRCPKCMICSEKGKNDRHAKLNWNKMIEEKMKEG